MTSPTMSRTGSMTLSLPPSRHPSTTLPSGPTSPSLTFSEDLSRFPTESLHSFSFAHQSEDFIHNRQNVLKRSIDFMRDRLNWAGGNMSIAQAQAKISGDHELQSMMELLARANLIGHDVLPGLGLGLSNAPITGPPEMSGQNIFEKSFLPVSTSPESMEDSRPASGQLSGEKVEVPAPLAEDIQAALETASADTEETFENFKHTDSMPMPRRTSSQRQRASLKRTYTDIAPLSIQSKLTDALAQPYLAHELEGSKSEDLISPRTLPTLMQQIPPPGGMQPVGSAPHGHSSRAAQATQAIFTTEARAPWTLTSANDLACLVFGVTRAEVRKMGILEVVQPSRRKWLEEKLQASEPVLPALTDKPKPTPIQSPKTSPTNSTLAVGNGVTAKLLSKPSSREAAAKKQAATTDGTGAIPSTHPEPISAPHHTHKKSRGVLICGDVVPIQKRNGEVGSASLWVKEKRGGLIWVLEEISEDVAFVVVDEIGSVVKVTGATDPIWGLERVRRGMDLQRLIPDIPKLEGTNTGALDYNKIAELRRFTARTSNTLSIPITVDQLSGESTFRVSSFPHIAGIMVLSSSTLHVTSSNSVFSAALFGKQQTQGRHIDEFIPGFDQILTLLTEEDKVRLVDGIVIPEHSFRRAHALLAMREGKSDAAAVFLRPTGLPAKHRDGAEIMVDVQMRVVKSERVEPNSSDDVIDERDEDLARSGSIVSTTTSEVVYALWITYSRQLHAANYGITAVTPGLSHPQTPSQQPIPGQSLKDVDPKEVDPSEPLLEGPAPSLLTLQIKQATDDTIAPSTDENEGEPMEHPEPALPGTPKVKKAIADFTVLEDMGQGAYGQVKLCRYKRNHAKKMVIKYVTKRRILVDTWTRDRRLGTVPLEIHVLNYLRRDDLRHPNIVEMADFFEDDVNYYIEMVPHGLPGMDLFDYIELRVNMDEVECRKIFVQVANAIHHLHLTAKVVHRDIKDENVILDGEGNIKLIDFGSAAYVKNGPFDVFVGTIDYAAPEVLAGRSYQGTPQDVWALGILLYTIVYKENPFYSIDEIMDHDLRVPYVMSDDCIDLIRLMLNRDVEARIDIQAVLDHAWCKGGEADNGMAKIEGVAVVGAGEEKIG
ncbi:Pkinase-domain-containing protein [Viridothelium virens]|uniref:non-specific serine/threonine protein kinase n=1 Tax=Viridothelium virens TaxID=1048519 RepID=A0A6A6HGZ5_VIRVR|nr:Pkinase-domain-containing protein [Viridothelium virens]